MTQVRAIQQINAARSARWMAGSPGWTTLEIAGELAGEVGELANICKKLRRSEMGVPGNKISDDDLRDQARGEIADVFIVLMLTASKLGIDLEDAVRETFNRKSEQMGFPERLPEAEEASNSDTDTLNWIDKWAVRIGLGDSGVYSFVWVDANGNESELPDADLYEKYENIRKAVNAARVLQNSEAAHG